MSEQQNEVVIVVLGDLGHSPRMSYHARSFEKLGYQVNLCGYLESNLPDYLKTPDISVYDVPVIKNKRNLPYILFAFMKVSSQFFDLTWLLKDVIDDGTRYVLVQNPPSLPVLLIIGLIKKFWAPHIQIIVDWHNLNWSILNLKYKNENNKMVRFMKMYEKYCARKVADFNITVSQTLKEYLIETFQLKKDKVLTLYDRPSNIFSPLDSREQLKDIVTNNKLVFGDINYNQNNDRILITSTSFTQDEDFTILVEALNILDVQLKNSSSPKRIIMIVTGKGPMQEDFHRMLDSYPWKKVIIKNLWLPIADYPKILKIADLGISLHYSSSGLDLPMKIVDLFGSGVPVITMNFTGISELVKDGINGLIMKNNTDASEMADKISSLLFRDVKRYVTLKEGALLESQRHWNDEWDEKLEPLVCINNHAHL